MGQPFRGAGSGPGGVGRTNGQATLKLWLRADVGVMTQGEQVVKWRDQSGNHNDALQLNRAAQPTYIASDPDFLSQPTMRFNAAGELGQFLRINHAPSLDVHTVCTIFLVFKPIVLEKTMGLLSKQEPCGTAINYALMVAASPPNNRPIFAYHHDTLRQHPAEQAIPSQPTILTFTLDSRFQWGAFGLNGQFAGQFSTTASLLPTPQPLDIGVQGRCQAEGAWFSGDLAELIFYQGSINTAQRIIIENYLSAKYGIQLPRTKRGKEIYLGNHPQQGSFRRDVAGIGREKDGAHEVAYSAGLTVRDHTFLQQRGDYLMVGHNARLNGIITTGLPDSVSGRWERVWFLELTNPQQHTGQVDWQFNRRAADMVTDISLTYVLLERADEYSPFTPIASADSVAADDIRFTLPVTRLTSGRQYTVGYIVPQPLLHKLKLRAMELWRTLSTGEPFGRRHLEPPKPTSLVAIAQPLLQQNRLTAADIQQAMTQISAATQGMLSRQAAAKVAIIQQGIAKTLPYIDNFNSSDPTVTVVRQTALEYLPETLEHYLNLPREFANTEPLKEGKTAHHLLLEQLDLLDRALQEISRDFHHQDARRLLAHGQFLRQKFGNHDSLLD